MEISSLRMEEYQSFDELFAIKGKVSSIIVVSAYVDIESINEILDLVEEKSYSTIKPSVKIYIDSSSSRFYSNRTLNGEFLVCQQRIKNICGSEGDSGIFLVNFGKLFHSKAYLIQGKDNARIILGSMNLTQNGITDNEELVFIEDFKIASNSYGSHLAKQVEEYVDELMDYSQAVDSDDNRKANFKDLRSFLLNGSIYYEVKEQDPFRFSLKLPDSVKRQSTNIDELLESNVTDSISLERLIIDSFSDFEFEDLSLDSSTESWKKYCVETCYGYWNPASLNSSLNEVLRNRKSIRRPYFETLKSLIINEQQKIKEAFLNLCDRINDSLLRENINGWTYSDLHKAEEDWCRWYDKLKEKVENEQFFDKLILGINTVPVPDIWNDPISSQEFEESFFNSICYQWSKEISRQTSNKIAQLISSNLGYDSYKRKEIDSDELRSDIESWFENNPGIDLFLDE
ncbi:MAG: phospholipase D-like domain-containing protein [Vibrio sp.]